MSHGSLPRQGLTGFQNVLEEGVSQGVDRLKGRLPLSQIQAALANVERQYSEYAARRRLASLQADLRARRRALVDVQLGSALLASVPQVRHITTLCPSVLIYAEIRLPGVTEARKAYVHLAATS